MFGESDMIFISETNLAYDALPTFDEYTLIADASVKSCYYGGIAWYVKDYIAKHVFQVSYNPAFISFRLEIAPQFLFIGVYIQPEGGRYFNMNMFSDLGSLLIECQEKGLVPFVGGDFNSRPGDLRQLGNNNTWNYFENIDTKTNKHGTTYFRDLCKVGDIKPVNGLKYRGKKCDNDFTFTRKNGKSQIDFCLTNTEGRKKLKFFHIVSNDWHLSDHRPITLAVEITVDPSISELLKRAVDLNYEHCTTSEVEFAKLRGTFDYDKITNNIIQKRDNIESDINRKLNEDDLPGAIDLLDEHIKSAHKGARKIYVHPTVDTIVMDKANEAFDNYIKTQADKDASENEIQAALDNYIKERKFVTKEIMKLDAKKWNDILKSSDKRSFWSYIDWKGKLKSKKAINSPSMNEFETFFEDLYKCPNQRELIELMEIESNVSVPVLDQPISMEEVNDAWKDMKKSGYDFKLPILNVLITYFSLMIVNLMNMIFYIKYPMSLSYSLLSLIPKVGNLMLPKNFRGIQMMKSLACLYDRIITNRLKLWLPIHVDQTAFQKLKSTLIHIFTIRLLIELVKKLNITLYIGSVDISKAFDHVPRALLLKKLVKYGIGKCMLFALKQLYSLTICIIKFQGELSDSFRMERGVRQGAASSVLLFNFFINGLFDYLKERCATETLLSEIHTLIHADDTLFLSTEREKFLIKFNEVVNFFTENGLTLNMGKSGYLIINAKETDLKKSIVLENGTILKYKDKIKYLGVFITDSGSLKHDIKVFMEDKRGEVSIKYTNFCKIHRNAPLHTKLDTLDTCMTSALTYGCETWGRFAGEADVCYRSGLKTALHVRQNVNNEIIYIETGKWPVTSRVKKAQLKFWLFLQDYQEKYPDAAVTKMIQIGLTNRLPYLSYYEQLRSDYGDPEWCRISIEREYFENFKEKINREYEKDIDSKLGSYLLVNPTLQKYVPYPQNIMELERELVTRYRTGSHSLAIELGRFSNTPRENRTCCCGNSVQSVWHIFFNCDRTHDLTNIHHTNLYETFADEEIHSRLLSICRRLNVHP